jgi:hypothetical protein
MQIICLSVEAAAQVLTIIHHAQMQPFHDYTIHPLGALTPPITVIFRHGVPSALLAQLWELPNIAILS